MKAVFTLTPAESKRLIAKGVAAMDIVKKAQENPAPFSMHLLCTFGRFCGRIALWRGTRAK